MVLGSIVVSICDCHLHDPGSIPGREDYFLLFLPYIFLNNEMRKCALWMDWCIFCQNKQSFQKFIANISTTLLPLMRVYYNYMTPPSLV
jgi:hypothetical protein